MAQVTTGERKSIFSLFNFIALIVLGVGIYLTYLRLAGDWPRLLIFPTTIPGEYG